MAKVVRKGIKSRGSAPLAAKADLRVLDCCNCSADYRRFQQCLRAGAIGLFKCPAC